MAYSPTIVAASLSDEELKKSVKSLVDYVDTQLNIMVASTNIAVNSMEKKLKSLGSIKIDSGGAADGGASRRAKAQSEETKAINETANARVSAAQKTVQANNEIAASYDRQAQAMQNATQPKSARDSYYTFAKHFSDQAKSLEPLIRNFEQNLSSLIQKRIDEINSRISVSKVKVQELNQELNRNYASGNTAAIQQTQNALEKENRYIKEQENLLKNVGQEFVVQKMYLTGLVAEQQNYRNYMRDNVADKKQEVNATQEQVEKERQVTSEIQRQAKAIRESADYKAGKNVIVTAPNGYEATINIKDKVSIEEKLTDTYEKHIRQKSELDRIEQTENQTAKERLGTEVSITNEIDKRRRYTSPETQVGYDVTRDKLAQIIATRNNIQKNQVVNWDEQTSSVKTLSAALKQYQEAYSRMTAIERNSPFGRQMVSDMQVLERSLQKLRQETLRPIDIESILKLPQKTLDDIAYKIRRLQTYRLGIDITKPNAIKEVNDVNNAIKNLEREMNSYMGKANGVISTNNALGRSWNYMKNRLAFYFTVGASTAFVKSLIDVRGQYELLERSIGILVDSMQQGTQVFSELNAMAIKSPFTTMELGAAAKQLVAYDVAAKDVVDTTRRLADMAAAVGIPIERLTYALGQVKAYGYLNARDARMFANAGIPLVKELADRYTELEGRLVSTADVYDRIKKKAISYEDVMDTVNKMTDEGGKFFNFQEKAADTLKVKIANLTLAYNNFLNEYGKMRGGIISAGLGITKEVLQSWRTFQNIILGVATAYGVLKTAQIAFLSMTRKTSIGAIFAKTVSIGLTRSLISLKAAMTAVSANPFTWALAAASAVAYLGMEYWDLVKANKAFNQSIVENTGENIKSVAKFLEDYKEQLASISSSDKVEQTKMWERMAEEIEKTTKNAKGYLEELEKINDLPSRIEAGKDVLLYSQNINREVERLAKIGTFDMGGGFANDSLAKNLQKYENALNGLIKDYGSIDKAQKELNEGFDWTGRWVRFASDVHESAVELVNFVSILGQADINSIMGDSEDDSVRLQNIREYAHIIRDNFLATEEGQKIGLEGRARLNRALDEWIAKQGVDNELIKDKAFGEQKYTAEQLARIEKTRTAWETFFNQLSAKDRETMDYIVSTGQYGSKEFQDIWDKAVENIKKSSDESYQAIKDQIADLRSQPDIVIRVVYQEEGKKGDAQQQAYKERFIKPQNFVARNLSPKEYNDEVKKNTEKYGTFIKKDGEDNVEWETRLGKTYRDNEESIKKLNAQLARKNSLNAASRAQKEAELKQLNQEQEALKDIREYENFNYNKEKKGGQKDPLGEALKQQIKLINEMRSSYDKLRKAGVEDTEAITIATQGYEKTVSRINSVLKKFNVPSFKPEEFAGKSYKSLLESLKKQRDIIAGNKNVKTASLEALDIEIKKLVVDAKAFDLQKVTEGLNKELGKVKEDYELAVEFDAMPELGGVFADAMGLNADEIKDLPRTYEQVVKKIQEGINKTFKQQEIGAAFDLSKNLREADFQTWVNDNARLINSDLVKALDDLRKHAIKIRTDETKNTVKDWNGLVEKYGTLQDKILKIYKESIKEQQTIADRFGTEQQKRNIRSLVTDIQLSNDPKQIAELQERVAQIVKQITDANPIALKVVAASKKGEDSKIAKAYWEDFKDTDLYAMTFEDMSRNSTYAIQLIIDKMEQLKDKVKEDPASMKALMKSLKDARTELEGRSSTNTFLSAISQWKEANSEIKATKKELQDAQDAETRAEQNVAESATKSIQERLNAEHNLAAARERLKKAQEAYANAENKGKAANEKFKASVNVLSAELGNVSNALSAVSSLFKEAGDADTAAAIDGINEGFSTMITLLTAVNAVILVLEASQPYLLAIAAAMSVVVGLAKWLSGSDNEKINEQVKESELAVKRLENQYKKLQAAVEDAYGTMAYAAQKAAVYNKKLQLEEMKRQLRLEQSRDSKDRDDDKIESLRGQIIDLEREIQKATDNWINDMLGISSVGDAAEQLVSSMIDAFRQGEDYMGKFYDSFDEMIENMIMKAITSKVIGEYIETMWDNIKSRAEARSQQEAQEVERTQAEYNDIKTRYDDYVLYENTLRALFGDSFYEENLRILEEQLKKAESQKNQALKNYEKAIMPTPSDVADMRADAEGMSGVIQEWFDATMKEWGITFGDKSGKNLSNLQQGIQGITEDTAGALEAMMNGISQQVYLQSEYLRQIVEFINIDADPMDDVKVASLSQILLQLQTNYTLMQTIDTRMENWSTATGNGIRVELLS